MAVSLNPEHAVQAGAFVPNVGVMTIIKARVGRDDYEWPKDSGTMIERTAVLFTLKDSENDTYEQPLALSIGKPETFWASSDETKIESDPSREGGISKGCNFYKWLTSAIDAGFPQNKVGDDVTVFEGLKYEAMAIPTSGKGETNGVKTIVSLDGGSDSAKDKGSKGSDTPVADTDDFDSLLVTVGTIMNGSDSFNKLALAVEVGKKLDNSSLGSKVMTADFAAFAKTNGYDFSGDEVVKA